MSTRTVIGLCLSVALVTGTGVAVSHGSVAADAPPEEIAGSLATASSGALTATVVSSPSPVAVDVRQDQVAGFPTNTNSYLVISTGDAGILTNPNAASGDGTDLSGGSVRGTTDFDVTIVRVDFNVASNANCLVGIDFRFLSEEYPEYVGSAYNDAFIIEVDNSTWSTSGSQITAPDNIAFDPAGNPITINASGVTSMTPDHAAGTTFDGGTPVLRAASPLAPGPHSLYLSIFDQGDRVLDSAVLVDNLQVASVANPADCKPGAVPVPTTTYRYVALGDSYASGEGTYSYDAHKEGARCHRGPVSWPRILEAKTFELNTIDHRACTGAKTAQLTVEYNANPPQIPTTPDPTIGVVTLMIGGNDVGFAGIIKSCYLTGSSCAKVPDSQSFENSLNSLYVKLTTEIYPKLKVAYPNAVIYHVGYPRITPKTGITPVRCGWLSNPEQVAAQSMVTKLNGTLYLATQASARIEWVDVTESLNGHELCTSDPWLVDLSLGFINSERAHPNAAGQAAIAKSVAGSLGFAYLPEF